MIDFRKLRERERELLQRKAKLESDLARLRTREKEAARRDDTRRKIVLGGALLAAVAEGEVSADFVRHLVEVRVPERDRKLFAGMPFAAPEAPDSDSGE